MSSTSGTHSGLRKVVQINVNGQSRQVDVPAEMPLLWALRDELGLVGTKYGCGVGLCGACTVHMDGRSVKSGNVLAVQADGSEVTTIEGLATDGRLHPMQEAFRECHALQCGYCTPGILVTAKALLDRDPAPSRERIREALSGNLCRCTGYLQIFEAVEAAVAAIGASASAAPETKR